MLQSVLLSDQSWALFILRLGVGVVMLPHGAQKLLGWWGGRGIKGTLTAFAQNMKVPAPIAFLVIIGESLGSAALVLGLLTRLDAVALVLIHLGAIFLVHIKKGFFVNKGGYEFNLLLLVGALILAIWGGGPLTLDAYLLNLLS